MSVEYCGLKLKNPLVVATAGITETVDRIKRCEDAGAAAVVMKSYFELPEARSFPTPAFKILRRSLGGKPSTTLYSYEQASHFALDEYAEELSCAAAACDIPVMASVMCVSEEGWQQALQACQQAEASAIEINTSCPHGAYALGQGGVVETAAQVIRLGRSLTDLPLIPKMSPQLTDPPSAARTLQRAGAAAVVMFNRFTGLDIDLDTLAPIMHGGYAGHGGAWMLHYTLRWLAATYPGVSIPIAASGGVTGAQDIAKLIAAGATVVQTCTAVVTQGYEVIGEMLGDLQRLMEIHGWSNIADLRGIVCDHIVAGEDVDRTRRKIASIDEETCTGCGKCHDICIYDAVKVGEAYSIVTDACSGCGLCAELCPVGCISMRSLA